MSSETSYGSTSPQGVFSVLDRITHLPSVLLLLAFVLAADNMLSWGLGTSLLSLSWSVIQQKITIGFVVVFLLSFGIFMATCLLILRYVADSVVHHTVLRAWKNLFPEDEHLRSTYVHAVRAWKLCETAHLEQNKFYFERYKEHQDSLSKFKEAIWRLASNAFACLMFLGVNSLILPKYGYTSMSHELATYTPGIWNAVSPVLTLGLFAFWLFPMFRSERNDEWVYCPPLANQLMAEKDKAQAE